MGASFRDPVEFYREHGLTFDRYRVDYFAERPWLAAFLALLPAGSHILDAGCGAGVPIARHIAGIGHRLVGIDTSPPMLALAQERIPTAEFVEADMRDFELDRQFDGIIAWDSFFHLSVQAQRDTLERFARHLRPRGVLMFTSGTEHGEAINPLYGENLYHASLDAEEYRSRLEALGFSVLRYAEHDIECGDRTIWLVGRGLEGTE